MKVKKINNEGWKKLETLRSLIWLWYHVEKNCISFHIVEVYNQWNIYTIVERKEKGKKKNEKKE